MKRLAPVPFALLLSASAIAYAQEFPDGSSSLTAKEIVERLGNRVFTVKPADGSTWRLEFRGSYFYLDTSTGFRGSGEWRAEDGKFCSQLRGTAGTCNEARLHNEIVHIKRTSGEVIQYLPR